MTKVVLSTKSLQEVVDDINLYLELDPTDDAEWDEMLDCLDRIQTFFKHLIDIASES